MCPGLFGSSQASVHSVRSWRAGLPVSARERTVLPATAASSLRVTAGAVTSASGDGQPQGAEPHPLGAEAEGGGHLLSAADAARREYGQRGDGVDDFGGEHHRGDLAGVAARLVALCDDDVDARLGVFARVPGAAREGRDEHPALVGACGPRRRAVSPARWRAV